MSEKKGFDELAREGFIVLLENFWILREKDPETYQLIRDRESTLKNYILDKCGYQLIVHRHFAKLEKIPAQPEPWMGISVFQSPLDYALLCCVLAYIEGLTGYEQFLLSDLCNEVLALYPEKDTLDWRNYEHRKALVRVLSYLAELGILSVVDGETTAFNFNEGSEVLYEVSVVARYFMRSYPKDLYQYNTIEELLAAENYDSEDEMSGARRRYRVYRQLLLSPVIYRQETEEADFLYLKNYLSRLKDDFETHTGFQLEVYKNSALLVAPEPRSVWTLFPNQKVISDITLQFSAYVREQVENQIWQPDATGRISLSWLEFEQGVKQCQEKYSQGWSKHYRDGLMSSLVRELLDYLKEWKFAQASEEDSRIILLPALGRLQGDYPQDFWDKLETKER